MPADDHPFDALEHQFEMEDLSVSPVAKKVLDIASAISLAPPFDKIVQKVREHLATDSVERVRIMLETCMNVVRKQGDEIDRLRERTETKGMRLREDVLKELLLDAARKAESTRARERVRRIGLILANAVVEPKPPDADEVEEMMRIATELSDRDVEFLRELIRIEGPLLETTDHIPRYDAHQKWENGWWGNKVIPEIDSAFSKLESYGLVARVSPPNNLNITADFQNRYVLLNKGTRFADLIQEAASDQGQAKGRRE